MTTETWDDINEHARQTWQDETTPFERVYEVIEETREGASAAEIAERALVSEPTARRHCTALVNTGFAETESEGRTTLYKRDPDRVLMTRIRELRETASREEIVERVREMKRELRAYETEYDAQSPEALARDLDSEETEGWNDLTDWQTTRRNLAIANAALAYDEASHELTA